MSISERIRGQRRFFSWKHLQGVMVGEGQVTVGSGHDTLEAFKKEQKAARKKVTSSTSLSRSSNP